MAQNSGSVYLGTVHHYDASAWLFFGLTATAGTPFSASAPALGTGSGKIAATVRLPDDTSYDIHTGGAPSNTIEELGSSTGFYRLRLWGNGQSAPHDSPLAQEGRCGIHIYSTVGDFEPLYGWYHVQALFDLNFSAVYSTSAGGSSSLVGAVTLHRWDTHQKLATPQSTLTSIDVRVRDSSGASILSMTNLASDFTQQNDSLFFNKAISGLVGSQVLVATVLAVYKGFTAKRDFLIPARFAA